MELVKKLFKRYFINAMGAMAQGLFASLLIGTIFKALGSFSFTFGQLWLGVAICSISISVINMIFGFGGTGGDKPRTSSTNKPKISKERRNDQF